MNRESPYLDPSDLPVVASIGDELTPEKARLAITLQDARSKTEVLRAVLNTWLSHTDQERSLRKSYASWLLCLFAIEVIAALVLFILLGAGVLVVSDWIATAFFVSVFTEVAACATLVTRSLFPATNSHTSSVLIGQILDHTNKQE